MDESSLLLRAYYELLYERLEANRDRLTARIEKILSQEIAERDFPRLNEDRYAAYRDTCLAFVDERMEMYNPTGVQYTFDNVGSREVFKLELQLNWYDSRAEYEALVRAAMEKALVGVTDENLRLLAGELIEKLGAFPDRSIISAYEDSPTLQKLPDYIVGRAIEEIIG